MQAIGDFFSGLAGKAKELVPGQTSSSDSLVDYNTPSPATGPTAGKRRKSKKTKKGGRKSRRKTARRV